MSTDREKGTRGNKRVRVIRGSRNPVKNGKRKHEIVHKPGRLN
jgi:hypothetical protein